MPGLYAHNKFGKKVLKNLSPTLRDLVSDYPNSFRLGLQGPDTLFFYRPISKNYVNQFGVKLHKEDAYPFFEDAISIVNANGFNSSCHAYLLGFICHFTLDNQCHPYVNASVETTNCGHLEIEGDFEHYLLSMDGFEPHKYKLYKLVPTDFMTALSLAPFYPNISIHQIRQSMKHMKMVKKLFVAPHPLKRNFIDLLMHANYKYFKGHMIMPDVNNKCRHCSEHLYGLLIDAVPIACQRIENFELCLINGEILPDIFHGNFNGDYIQK